MLKIYSVKFGNGVPPFWERAISSACHLFVSACLIVFECLFLLWWGLDVFLIVSVPEFTYLLLLIPDINSRIICSG